MNNVLQLEPKSKRVLLQLDIKNSTRMATAYRDHHQATFANLCKICEELAKKYPRLRGEWKNDCGEYHASAEAADDALLYAIECVLALATFNLQPSQNNLTREGLIECQVALRGGIVVGDLPENPIPKLYEATYACVKMVRELARANEIMVSHEVKDHTSPNCKALLRYQELDAGIPVYRVRPSELLVHEE